MALRVLNPRQVGTLAALPPFAAEHGHLEVVRLLFEAGADKDAADTDGSTALRFAARNGHLEVVQLLREAGADKDAAHASSIQ